MKIAAVIILQFLCVILAGCFSENNSETADVKNYAEKIINSVKKSENDISISQLENDFIA